MIRNLSSNGSSISSGGLLVKCTKSRVFACVMPHLQVTNRASSAVKWTQLFCSVGETYQYLMKKCQITAVIHAGV
mgnify:CR=1 FL=1